MSYGTGISHCRAVCAPCGSLTGKGDADTDDPNDDPDGSGASDPFADGAFIPSPERRARLFARVRALRAADEPENPQLVVGQYAGYADEVRADEADWLRSKNKPADAIEAALAAPDSATPTFAAARLHVDGARWGGVPWVLVAGKQLNERAAYVRVLFHDSECNPVRRIERSPNAPGHLNAPLHVTHSY